MKLLLTSAGITNKSVRDALVSLLGKPIVDSNALFVPTAIYPFPFGARFAWNPIAGASQSALCGLGWKSLGLLELTALPSIDKEVWLPALQDTDALLVWGGDPLYLSYWLQQSGLLEYLPSLLKKMVYVGVSAGSMAASSVFGETYTSPRGGVGNPLSSAAVSFHSHDGEISRTFIKARGSGLVEFAVIPHYNHPDHPDASTTNVEKWAGMLPLPAYAIDDQTAIQVFDDKVQVVSEGHWLSFQ